MGIFGQVKRKIQSKTRGRYSPTRYAKNRGKTKGLRDGNSSYRGEAKAGRVSRKMRYGRSMKGF